MTEYPQPPRRDLTKELADMLAGVDAALWTPHPKWLTGRVGRRGTALLFFAFLDLIYAFNLFRPPPGLTAVIAFNASVAPLWFWGCLWSASGLLCLYFAFRRRDEIGFAAAVLIKTLWGLLAVGSAFGGVDRWWVSAAIWLSAAGWIAIISTWPEPPSLRYKATPPPAGREG